MAQSLELKLRRLLSNGRAKTQKHKNTNFQTPILQMLPYAIRITM